MCLSHHIEKALAWVHAAECEGGGVASTMHGHTKGGAYPEVTGYLIPTLMDWQQYDLAFRFMQWLLEMDDGGGGYPDPAGVKRSFDTAQVVRGLRRVGVDCSRHEEWARSLLGEDGRLEICHGTDASHTAQVLAEHILLGEVSPYWVMRFESMSTWPWATQPERLHYIAYALEGLRDSGHDISGHLDAIKKLRFPLPWSVSDGYRVADPNPCVVANFQFALLLEDEDLYRQALVWQDRLGGFPARPGGRYSISWATKYMLDCAKRFEG